MRFYIKRDNLTRELESIEVKINFKIQPWLELIWEMPLMVWVDYAIVKT